MTELMVTAEPTGGVPAPTTAVLVAGDGLALTPRSPSPLGLEGPGLHWPWQGDQHSVVLAHPGWALRRFPGLPRAGA